MTFDESKLTPEQRTEREEIKKQREIRDNELWLELKDNPPKPPWIAYPDYDRYSMGWRMSAGEDHIHKLYVYFKNSSKTEYEKYRQQYPEPPGWEGWYDE